MRALIFAVSNALIVPFAFALPGDLDPTFVISPPPSQRLATLVQPDGKIIASGADITRYRPDGTVDTVFGGSALVEGFFPALALQPDGKLVAAGGSNVGEGYVLRFLPDGSPDPSFTPAYPGGNVTCVTVLPDGRILAGGFFFFNGRANLIMLMPDGQVDFGFAGEVAPSGVVNAVAAQPDGAVLVGWSQGLVRFTRYGVVDPTFAGLSAPFGVSAVTVLPDGRVLAGGEVLSDAGNVSRGGIARLLPNGYIDPTFTADIESGSAKRLVVQPWDGRILAAGQFTLAGNFEMVARFLSDGTLDTSFHVPINGGEDFIGGIAVQYDGKVIVAGYLELPTPHLVRLENDLARDTFVFQSPAYRVLENAGHASIGVVRYGPASRPGSVSYNTTPGTAQPSYDYLSAAGTLNFAPGQHRKSFTVRILDDQLLNEPDETVNLNLSRPRGSGVLGPDSRAVLRIIENDID